MLPAFRPRRSVASSSNGEYGAWREQELRDKQYVYLWADGLHCNVRFDEARLCLLLKRRELKISAELAVGDGTLGFRKALREVYGDSRQQRCWMHKTGNVLNYLPKSTQPKAKKALHEIWQAETRDAGYGAFDAFIETYEAKSPKATACLEKDREELLARSATFRLSSGHTYAPPIRSSRPSLPFDCALRRHADAYPVRRR